MRRILSPTIEGQRFVMTQHRPETNNDGSALVLFNSGQVPRDGHGGLSVQLAEAAAARGVTAYRVDLPGNGDSPGPLPRRVDSFWRQNETGLQAASTANALHYIKTEHRHRHIYAGGLCGAANNALFCSQQAPELINGLVLIEPQFFFSNSLTEVSSRETSIALSAAKQRRSGSIANWSRLITAENRYTRRHPRLRRTLMALASQAQLLGSDTNLDLARAFAAACRAKLPLLCIVERNGRHAVHLERVQRALLTISTRRGIVTHALAGTNHVLTEGEAIRTCACLLADWLSMQRECSGAI